MYPFHLEFCDCSYFSSEVDAAFVREKPVAKIDIYFYCLRGFFKKNCEILFIILRHLDDNQRLCLLLFQKFH